MDYPETSGNRLRRFPTGFRVLLKEKKIEKKYTKKKFGNLLETSAAGFRRFQAGFRIIYH